MKYLRLSLIGIFIALVTSFAYAGSAPAELASLLNGVRTMKADFDQTIYDNHGKAIQHANGHMALERPGKFRWEISHPIPQLVIANQTRLWIYDPDLAQVTERSFKHTTGETPALLLSHTDAVLDKEFDIKELKNAEKVRWFNLVPHNGDNFAAIQLAFMNRQIYEMRLQDHLGHTTHIRFKNTKINMPISSATFVFKAPAKVDVIHEKSS